MKLLCVDYKPFLFCLINFNLISYFLSSLCSFYIPSKLNYLFSSNIPPCLLPVSLHVRFSVLGPHSFPCVNQVSDSILFLLNSPGWLMVQSMSFLPLCWLIHIAIISSLEMNVAVGISSWLKMLPLEWDYLDLKLTSATS